MGKCIYTCYGTDGDRVCAIDSHSYGSDCPDCLDYAAEKPPPAPPESEAAGECIYIRHCSCGKFICGFAMTGPVLPDTCGLDCGLYTTAKQYYTNRVIHSPAYKPQSPTPDHDCSCSPQPRRARPFVRVDGAIILLDEFDVFTVDKFDPMCYRLEGLRGKNWIPLRRYTSCEFGKENLKDVTDTALDTIQAAIEHWSRAATEPERNVRLKSITENLDYPETKRKMIERFKEMGIDPYDANNESGEPLPVRFPQVWAALVGVFSEKL